MVTQVKNINDFTNDLLLGDKFNFESKFAGRYIRIFSASFRNKVTIHEHLKQCNIQHYLILDRQSPIKVVIRDLSDLRIRS